MALDHATNFMYAPTLAYCPNQLTGVHDHAGKRCHGRGALGRELCRELAEDGSRESVVQNDMDSNGMTRSQAEQRVTAAENIYCPQYSGA
jgi:hypothetical protein